MTDAGKPEPLSAERERDHREETSVGRSWWRCVPVEDAIQREHAAREQAATEARRDLLAELRLVIGRASTGTHLCWATAQLAVARRLIEAASSPSTEEPSDG